MQLPIVQIKFGLRQGIWSDLKDQIEFWTDLEDQTERLLSLEQFTQIRTKTEVWSKNKSDLFYQVTHCIACMSAVTVL